MIMYDYVILTNTLMLMSDVIHQIKYEQLMYHASDIT